MQLWVIDRVDVDVTVEVSDVVIVDVVVPVVVVVVLVALFHRRFPNMLHQYLKRKSSIIN